MKEASSEARKQTSAGTSTDSPRRLTGWSSLILAIMASLRPLNRGVLMNAGPDAVDANTTGCILQRCCLGQDEGAMLGCDVSRAACKANAAQGGRHVNDAAAAPRQHRRDFVAHA